MKKIIIQAGHLNIKSNCDISLRGSTGAGGEVEVNTAVRDMLGTLLKARGVEVRLVDANFNCDSTSADADYDLFLTLHCDMDYTNDNGSGFCDFPEPSTDGATLESQRLAKEIQNSFFPAVGINIKSRSNANTRYYYMWKFLSSLTPCVLIEMGQVKDPHDSVILKDTQKVASALSKAILLALGVEDASEGQIEALEAKIEELEEELSLMRDSRNTWKAKSNEVSKQLEEVLEALEVCTNNKTTLTNLLETEMATRKELEGTITELKNLIERLQKMSNNPPLSEYTVKELFGALFKKIGR